MMVKNDAVSEGIQVGGRPARPGVLAIGGKVARDLGILPGVVHKWIKQLEVREPATAFPGNGKVAEPVDEVRRLRRELEQVKQERDFLRKRQRSSRASRREVRVRCAVSRLVSGGADVSGVEGQSVGVVQGAAPTAECTDAAGCPAAGGDSGDSSAEPPAVRHPRVHEELQAQW